MKDYESTEIAYKNGYAQGKKDAVKHGFWIHDINNLYGCAVCGCRETMSHNKKKNYCPHCGAKMDLEVVNKE